MLYQNQSDLTQSNGQLRQGEYTRRMLLDKNFINEINFQNKDNADDNDNLFIQVNNSSYKQINQIANSQKEDQQVLQKFQTTLVKTKAKEFVSNNDSGKKKTLTSKLNGKWQKNALMIIMFVKKFINYLKSISNQHKFKELTIQNFQLIGDHSINYYYYQKRQFLLKDKQSFINSKIFQIQEKFKDSDLFVYIIKKFQIFNSVAQFFENRIIIIMPDSIVKLLWDFLILILLIANLIYIPLKISFFQNKYNVDQDITVNDNVKILLEQLPGWAFCLDILLNFNTAYYLNGIIITDRKQISIHYIKKQFFLDFIIIGCFILSLNLELVYLDLILILRISKISQLFNNIVDLFNLKELQMAILDLIKLFMLIIFIAHFCGCGFYLIQSLEQDKQNSWIEKFQLSTVPWIEKYISCIYWAIITMITVGYGDIYPTTSYEKIYVIIFALLSCGVFAYALSSVGQIVQSMSKKKIDFKIKMNNLTKYMRKRKLGLDLQTKVKKYFEYLHAEQMADNEEGSQLLNKLPTALKNEVLKDINYKVLKSTKVFSLNFSHEFMKEISLKMKEKKFGIEEIIINQGEVVEKMFFIVRGEVQTYIKLNNELRQLNHLKAGQVLGKLQFFTGSTSNLSAISTNVTQVIYMNKADFLEIIQRYPMDFEKFHMLKDNYLLFKSSRGLDSFCTSCGMFTHEESKCSYLQYVPNTDKIIRKHQNQENEIQIRQKYDRTKSRFVNSLSTLYIIRECSIQYILQNFDQEKEQLEDIIDQVEEIQSYHKKKDLSFNNNSNSLDDQSGQSNRDQFSSANILNSQRNLNFEDLKIRNHGIYTRNPNRKTSLILLEEKKEQLQKQKQQFQKQESRNSLCIERGITNHSNGSNNNQQNLVDEDISDQNQEYQYNENENENIFVPQISIDFNKDNSNYSDPHNQATQKASFQRFSSKTYTKTKFQTSKSQLTHSLTKSAKEVSDIQQQHQILDADIDDRYFIWKIYYKQNNLDIILEKILQKKEKQFYDNIMEVQYQKFCQLKKFNQQLVIATAQDPSPMKKLYPNIDLEKYLSKEKLIPIEGLRKKQNESFNSIKK